MASSSFTNAYLVDFESVLKIPDQEGMQKMFKALENSGLHGFLGCKPVLFLSEIVQFFETALVQDNDITGAISGMYFTITLKSITVKIVSEIVGSKKRPAVVGEEPVIAKKKRTSKGKPPSSQASLISIAQGAVPLQMIEPTIAAPVDKPPASKRQSKRRIFVLPTVSEDEDEEDAVEGTVDKLLSAAHSKSLEDFKARQQEHKIEMVQPNSSLPVIYSIDRSGVRLAHFYSIAKSICWVRPMVLIDEVWTPLQGSGYWRSNCKLSHFVDRKRLPVSVVAENFDSQVSLIEPARYWGAAPLLIKIWAWQQVCTEAIQFSVSGRLRPASFSSDIVIGNLGVERLPDYFLDDFEQGVNTDYFVEFLSGSSGQSGSEFDSASSSGDIVYRSPYPSDYAYALGPPIMSPTVQEERLYFVLSPDSSPAASPQQSSISQRIHESTYEILSKVNDVEFSVQGDLLKQQAWLRQTFQNACEVLERQSTQMNDLKKGLMSPVGTIFQDLFDIKKNQRAQEAKLNALDGQVAAIRNEQLEFQNKISADLLSLSTQFAEIVDYIRDDDAKKGEGGISSRPPPVRVERRPLPTPQSPRDVAGGSSAISSLGKFAVNSNWNSRAVDRSKDKSKDRSTERSKDRSKDRRMRTSSNKRFSRKQDHKVLVAEESTKSWADSDSESSSSSSSSSDSEQEEVHCLMADHAEDDEVFDFANTELHVKTLSLHLRHGQRVPEAFSFVRGS
ncbi:hypothetical protein F511_03498 [Dorcoceras hygrometricum]|uniref:Uncharacterized protein n=1 Tax=Dorcoceras hygrometricum TaxID=472368 RepID=A0A2Z7AQI0_9LAMI|nr:hypothetical protein F511_03498 [Dorcoceras hygrometricum]